jgi:hypothetical protein
MLADVEKLVLLHDDGLYPVLLCKPNLAHTVSLVRPRSFVSPAACSLTLPLREVR